LAPQLESLAGGRLWATAAGCATAALVLFGWGAATVRTDARHPVPSSLVYAEDRDSGAAWLTSPAWGMRSAWARRLVDSGGAQPDWLRHTFQERRVTGAVPVSRVPGDGATARVVADTEARGVRRVTLQVTPVPGSLMVGMRAVGGQVIAAAVDGRSVDPSGYRWREAGWFLSYTAPPDSGYSLALILPAGQPLDLDVVVRVAGIPDLPGHPVPPRPPSVVAMQWGDITVLHTRVHLQMDRLTRTAGRR
jgi:hypothetical protein